MFCFHDSPSLPLCLITMARSRDFVMPPEMYRSLPLQSEWQRTMSGQNMAIESAKIRMRRIVLQPRSAGIGGTTMAKILFRAERVKSRGSKLPMRDTRIHFEYF